MNSRPRSSAGTATLRNKAGGRPSTTTSQISPSASGAMNAPAKPGSVARARASSRTDTAVSASPGTPARRAFATVSPTPPSPASPTVNPTPVMPPPLRRRRAPHWLM